MNFRILTGAVVLLCTAVSASNACAEEVAPTDKYASSNYITGTWKYPTKRQVHSHLPRIVLENQIEVVAIIDCQVSETGPVNDCDVLDEQPSGYGAGAAIAYAFVKHASVKPDTVEGGIKPNARRRFMYRVMY